MILTTLQLSEPYGRVTYRDAGAGAAVLLIHGLGMQSAAWSPQIVALSQTYRVIAVDLPGHGGSNSLSENAELPDFVAWLHAVVVALELAAVNVAGHSMGALIAGGYAAEYPRKVERVAVLNGVYRRDPTARAAAEARAAEIRQGKFDMETPLNRWFGDAAENTDNAQDKKNKQAIRKQVAEWLGAVDSADYATAYAAFARGDSTYADDWARITCPMLALTGDGDVHSTPAMSQAMAAAAADGVAKIIPRHRHLINLTAADEVTALMQDWLVRVPTQKAA